ncbi:hypothetical protein DDT91_15870 [Algoriphagus sp. AK58]|nr:hypothetical protein [Algoriphagus sp. AK58]
MFRFFIFFFSLSVAVYAQERPDATEARFLKEVFLTPLKLKLEGDSVRFGVKGNIPVESVLIPRNPKLKLVFRSPEVSLELGEISLTKTLANFTYDKKFSIKYESWMEGGSLELQFFQGKKTSSVPFETRILAKGVIAPQLLVRIGQVFPDETIPQVGLYMLTGALDRELEEKKEFSFVFNLGASSIRPGAENVAVLNSIDEFLKKNPTVIKVKVTGLQSPEASESKIPKLGVNRAREVGKSLVARFPEISESSLVYDSRSNDWFDFRLLLRDYQGISTQRKDEMYAILLSGESFQEQGERLKKVPGYSQASSDLFPKLRSVKVEITAKPFLGLDMEQTFKLKEALSNPESGHKLSFGEWALAAEASQSLEEKALIYSKMTELFRSALPYNNMAVVRLRQAQRTLDQGSKEILWDEADRLLVQAFRIEANPYSLHNQGQILALKGEYWEAYKKLSEASVMSKNPDFVLANEMLRGALDVMRGDYKLATLRFDYKITDPRHLFNKGLAYYLVGDYAQATMAFEESVIHGRALGYGYYGLAMIAIQTGQGEIASIHLKNAIGTNSQLKEKAYLDPIFEELMSSNLFFEGISK